MAVLVGLGWMAAQLLVDGGQAYADSKLHGVLLAFAVARLRPGTCSNSLEPGWATRMGGPNAPDDRSLAPLTQTWLVAGEDPAVNVTGQHYYHQQPCATHPAAHDPRVQDALLARMRSDHGRFARVVGHLALLAEAAALGGQDRVSRL